MRHRVKGRKLGRTAEHRKAMLSNLVTSLIAVESLTTTIAKAKEARGLAERMISFAKNGDLASRRRVLRTVRDKSVARKLFEVIAPRYKDRQGGYTRIVRLGPRKGDGAELAVLELAGRSGEAEKERPEKRRLRRKKERK